MCNCPEIVGIGAAVYDILMVIDEYPVENTKKECIETKIQAGGPCATALVAAQLMGASTAYMGTIGDDTYGNFILEDMKHWGVDVRYTRQAENAVSFHSVIFLNKSSGSRTCVWSRGNVPQLQAKDLNEELLKRAKVLHIDGQMTRAAAAAAKLCHDNHVKVSYDAGGIYPNVEELIPYVDWMIPSEEYAMKLTGEKTPEAAAQKIYHSYHPELVILTQGTEGGILLDEKGLRRYESYKVPVLDSNGCGDVFHGAFIIAKIRGFNNDMACMYASAAAAIKCTKVGARTAIASFQKCREFLLERGALI